MRGRQYSELPSSEVQRMAETFGRVVGIEESVSWWSVD